MNIKFLKILHMYLNFDMKETNPYFDAFVLNHYTFLDTVLTLWILYFFLSVLTLGFENVVCAPKLLCDFDQCWNFEQMFSNQVTIIITTLSKTFFELNIYWYCTRKFGNFVSNRKIKSAFSFIKSLSRKNIRRKTHLKFVFLRLYHWKFKIEIKFKPTKVK